MNQPTSALKRSQGRGNGKEHPRNLRHIPSEIKKNTDVGLASPTGLLGNIIASSTVCDGIQETN